MRIFCAQISTETNTFSPIPTGKTSFEEFGIYRGNASLDAPEGVGLLLKALRNLADRDGVALVESVCVFAQPAGRTEDKAYAEFSAMLLEDLRAAGHVDAVLMVLHGAMASQSCDDCEGDILRQIREIVGPDVPIGAVLDLHCHLTQAMLDAASAIVCYKEYPHIDGEERVGELYHILLAAASGRARPVTAVHDLQMVGQWHTTRDPVASFVRQMKCIEAREGILSVSLVHGFPWGDVEEAGAKIIVIADGALELAEDAAIELGQAFWSMRFETRTPTTTIDEAIDEALSTRRLPVIVADMADNPGGGAPGDSSFLLSRLLEREVSDVAIGAFWDPGAVEICRMSPVGADLTLRIGGKVSAHSGMPIDLECRLKGIVEDIPQTTDVTLPSSLGACAWLSTGDDIDIILASVRNQVLSRDVFERFGISLRSKRIIVVKSMQHFYAAFAEISDNIYYVNSAGALDLDFGAIKYVKRDLNFWPRVENPFNVS